mmetsp:Transcript_4603/g.6372  ORF Transcript_4603/g.6372 Transcript_4603/m.6372 type:complete len:146 (-) Transcript_4603:164-601(-)
MSFRDDNAKAREYGSGFVSSVGVNGRNETGRAVCSQVAERVGEVESGKEGTSKWDIGFLLGFSFGLGAVLTCAVVSWLHGLRKPGNFPPALEAEEEIHECAVCMHYRINCVLDPCGHQFCSFCARKVDACPICRVDVNRLIGTYR